MVIAHIRTKQAKRGILPEKLEAHAADNSAYVAFDIFRIAAVQPPRVERKRLVSRISRLQAALFKEHAGNIR